jgi:transcriptional regulator with XRE-family HTH domain
MTANQVVAANLRRIRLEYGITQEQAAEFTAPYLPGGRWSRVVWSSAERSVSGKRVRRFDADEIMGLALGLGVPIAEFFRSPQEPELHRIVGAGAEKGVGVGEMRRIVVGDTAAGIETLDRARELLSEASELISMGRSEAASTGEA